ncbi:MAG TPA: hypothetical protein VN646_03250 [Candidatus Acidoferrum sp.]|jgi:hypothetical protein|nr:hypothetical protein [Candidatus Acidoferrum sp.]
MTRRLAAVVVSLLLVTATAAQAQAPMRVRGTITAVDGNGDGVGATTRPGPGGALTALEVHVFPPNMPVPNEGHRPWDLEPGSMTTNARVTAVVQSTNGRELTLTYKDGAQRIVVPERTPIVTAVPADRSALKAGEFVFFSAEAGADGTLTPTGRIQVSRDGVKPPM